ncbi:molybdopterin-containing oxidoreductase family protein [Nevskia soli]|uniref:molybdopterin-containing oxidoreductase family protein n=1 Tax=Nevskia soli TaxID=418856 RepID=UPI00068ACDDC|nr:molybdopterin-dependent oxidoreductase [Nevskia soli]
METKRVSCKACDIMCNVLADVDDGRIVRIHRDPNHPVTPQALCNKGSLFSDTVYHKDRLMYPLKRVGERGEGKWEQVSWEEALDGVAVALKGIVAKHGPESVMTTAGAIVPIDIVRRFTNLLGSPNFTMGAYVCLGNTTGPNKATYGWMPFPDWWRTKCIVLMGHDPQPNKWTSEFLWLREALKRGAKLIVVDPRVNFHAKRADMHLRIRPGTDSALMLGWIHVIINEGLYDKAFVEKYTHGFEELKSRVQEYTPEKVSELTWIPAEQIVASARMYATSGPAIIPWTPVTDKHANSTHSIRCYAILRAICGNLDVPGGEIFMHFNPNVVVENEVHLTHMLSKEQMDKQLGQDRFKVLSYDMWRELDPHTERVMGKKWANQIASGSLAHPADVWTAMETGQPYPVKALLAVGANTLGGYTNIEHIFKGLMNCDLIVAHEIFMTPTAQLADYVFPSTTWAEKYSLHNHWDWHNILMAGDKAVDAPAECRDEYHFWRELAVRMGQEAHWPWKTSKEFFDWRLEPMGKTFDEFLAAGGVDFPDPQFKKYEKVGFGTPTGKVELYSTLFEKYGYDPLPAYVEQACTSVSASEEIKKEYPLTFFVGGRSEPYFQSQGRQIHSLRSLCPDPAIELYPETAYDLGFEDGDWVYLETPQGRIKGKIRMSDDAHPNVVRVPYMWWFPEQQAYLPNLSGQFQSHDGMILPDSDEFADREQGVPTMGGLLCKIYRVPADEARSNTSGIIDEVPMVAK